MFLKCALLLLLCDFILAEYPYSYQTLTCRLPRIEHGRVRTRQRSKLVKFMCSNRYELVGNRYATCRNGNWDVPTPVCVRPGCSYLPQITNGVQIKAHHDAWVVNFCLPGYKLQGSHSMFCDGVRWNATVPKCVEDTGINQPSLSCDFEDENICGWTQDELHDFDWKRLNTKTPSSFLFTGPSYDHTYGKGHSGYYMYIESTSRLENDTARLLSPIYDVSLATNGCFSFYYHMFGKETGGLRIYQKPDSLRLHEMLNMTEVDRGQYLLFQQWGNLGDTWFQAVPALKDSSESFQIIIEGIRGSSFTSDIAIDDVSILQGENCTAAISKAVTPTSMISESCLGRCMLSAYQPESIVGCDCTPFCLPNNNCCPDFLEVCVFEDASATDDDSNSSSAELPQTQKLVGETTTTAKTTTTSTTQKTTPKSILIPIPPITPKISTTTKFVLSTIPPLPTTMKTTTQATKTTTTTTTKKSTIQITVPKTTATTTKKVEITTRKPITTTKKVEPTTKKVETTTKKVETTTKKVETTTRKGVTTTVKPRKVTKSATMEDKVEQKKEDEKMTLQKMVSDKPQKAQSSTWKTAVITIVVLALCASFLYLGVVYRRSQGLVALQRLWGRTRNDPEVRYLNSNDDDEL